MKNIFWALMISFIIYSPVKGELSKELSGLQIVEKQKKIHMPNDYMEKIDLQMINKKDQIINRKITIHGRKNEQGLSKRLVKFNSPADIRDVGLLTLENSEKADRQWIYTPANKKIKRISSGGKKSRFMGTDFSYEDLQPEKISAHEYKLLRIEELNNKPTYVIESTPNNARERKNSGYSKRIFWINKKIFFTVKTEFYGRRDRLIKIANYSELQNIKDNMWRTNKIVMQDLKRKHKSIMTVTKRSIDQGLKESLFTREKLKMRSK